MSLRATIFSMILENVGMRDIISKGRRYSNFRITTKSTPLSFVLAYRPPSSRQENTEELSRLLRSLDNNTLVIGDINMPDIDWREGRAGNSGKLLLLETTQEEDLQQMVSFPTHIKGNILDLVITNCPDKVLDISDGGRLGKSDHCIIMVDINATFTDRSECRKP
jgi:hypothetical protein